MPTPTAIAAQDIWIVIPGYNEVKYLHRVLEKLAQLPLPGIQDRVIFVDDGSSDATAAVAKKHLRHVLVHRLNLGKGSAMKTGCEYAFGKQHAQAVIFMDSDDQHDPAELQLFFDAFAAGAQVVFGERRMGSEMPLIRIMGNRFASFLIYALFGRYIPDIPSGFKAISQAAYDRIKWRATRYDVELEIAARVAKYSLPFTTVEIKTIYHDMDRGMTTLDAVKMIASVVALKVNL